MDTNTTYHHHDPDTSAGTIRAYSYGWLRYTRWCETEGLEPWNDPDGQTFARFVQAEVRAGRKPNTISQCRAAIAYRYRTDPALYGLADPSKSEAVNVEMKRLQRRTRGQRPAKAPAMTPDILEHVVKVSAVRRARESAARHVERHLEFEATLRLMFDSALRCDDMMRAEWGDLTDDGALYVRPGKTPHDRHGHVSAATAAALARWRAVCPTPDGRISTARSPRALGERIRRAGAFAGVEISGHSPRRGVLTATARAGASMSELMAVGGHKTAAMVGEYVDAPHAQANAVSKLYGAAPPEPDPEPVDGFGDDVIDLMVLAGLEAALSMAVKLDAPIDHLAVVETRQAIMDLWPEGPPPPRPCERPGCPGLVGLRVGSGAAGEKWCHDICRTRTTSRAAS